MMIRTVGAAGTAQRAIPTTNYFRMHPGQINSKIGADNGAGV
jgi:hypothetical protein